MAEASANFPQIIFINSKYTVDAVVVGFFYWGCQEQEVSGKFEFVFLRDITHDYCYSGDNTKI